MNLTLNLISLFGVFGICFIAWSMSENKRVIPWNVIKWGLGLQLVLGFLIFVLPFTRDFILKLNDIMNAILDASEAGSRFLFGSIIVPDPNKAQPPGTPNLGVIFAFRSLPQVVFFSALITLAYRLNVIQPVIKVFSKVFYKTMGISGAESLSGAANIFVGIESIVSVRPYLEKMTRSEICAILTSCFGSISSTVMAIYANALRPSFPAITGHLMAASVLTIPACFVVSKLMVPETETPETLGILPNEELTEEQKKQTHMDALIKGAMDGVQIAIGIASVLVAILGIIAILNWILASLASWRGNENTFLHIIGFIFSYITIDNIFAILFLPLTFLTGVSLDWSELWYSSMLIGNRVMQTAIPSFNELQRLAANQTITDRALLIVSYVLCGFAHIPSMGIFIGGMTSLVPSRSSDIQSVAFKSLIAGTLATIMTGCIAGIFDFGNPGILGK